MIEEEIKDLIRKRKLKKKISENINIDRTEDENEPIIGQNNKSIENKNDKFLKNKRLRTREDFDNEPTEKISIEENNILIKQKDLKKISSNNKNKTLKRLNFEDIEVVSDDESKNLKSDKDRNIRDHKLNQKIDNKNKRFYNLSKRFSSRRNTKVINSKLLENKETSKNSPSKDNFSKKNNKTKVYISSNNITPVKSPKKDYYRESHISADNFSFSSLNNRPKRSIKKISFDNVQDSIRIKKSRSMSSSSDRSRSSSIHLSEKSEEKTIMKTRHSPRIERKFLDHKKINEKLKGINKFKKKKIMKKSKIKSIKSTNREFNSLEKVDFTYNSPRDRTPEKFKSPLKNSVLSGKFR